VCNIIDRQRSVRTHLRRAQDPEPRSAWTGAAPGATTCSSSGCGSRSSPKRSTCMPTTRWRPPAGIGNYFAFYNVRRPHTALDMARPQPHPLVQSYIRRQRDTPGPIRSLTPSRTIKVPYQTSPRLPSQSRRLRSRRQVAVQAAKVAVAAA